GAKPWFLEVHDSLLTRVISPSQREAVLYVVAPVVRDARFTGAFVGGLDLTRDRTMAAALRERPYVTTLLATGRGSVVYPRLPPAFTRSADWFSIFQGRPEQAAISEVIFDAAPATVANAHVPVGDLFLLNSARRADLFH